MRVVLHPPAPVVGVGRASLQHGRCDLVVSPSPSRLLRALDGVLGRLASPGAPSGTVAVRDMGAVVRDGAAHLVPRSLLNRTTAIERLIRTAGAAIADPEVTRVDPGASDVVVDVGLRPELGLGTRVDEVVAQAGPYRLRAIHWPPEDFGADEHPGSTLVRLLVRSWDLDGTDRQELLEALASVSRLSAGTPTSVAGVADLEGILERLTG
ncbi:hypothetical protein NHL50_09425 [Acidimicrobiia bacterium EGI L10123]|uniref:hypothetical protein n=1 Tax=Salinilacustrithrix flava TaxID=2957203 RepID=UPI003D7C2503|nr:hypothetical protein [Acidimicrobiia bacterium EGI L10123]